MLLTVAKLKAQILMLDSERFRASADSNIHVEVINILNILHSTTHQLLFENMLLIVSYMRMKR